MQTTTKILSMTNDDKYDFLCWLGLFNILTAPLQSGKISQMSVLSMTLNCI